MNVSITVQAATAIRGVKWINDGRAVDLELVSPGFGSEEWITYFKEKGYPPYHLAEDLIRSEDFRSTPAGTIHRLIIVKSQPGNCYRSSQRIRRWAMAGVLTVGPKLLLPNAFDGCLIRDVFTDRAIEAMGWKQVLTMHRPIPDRYGMPSVIGTQDYADFHLFPYNDEAIQLLGAGYAYAFAA